MQQNLCQSGFRALHLTSATRPAHREDLRPSSRYLRELCYFANPAVGGDVALLAATCNLVLSPKSAAGSGQVPQQQGQQPVLEFCSYAGGGPESRASVLQLSQRLLALVLRALSIHAARFRELQHVAGQAGSTTVEQLRGTVMPLVKAVVVLAGGGALLWQSWAGWAGWAVLLQISSVAVLMHWLTCCVACC